VRAWEGYHYKDKWQELQKRGMEKNFAWDHSAQEYVKLYRRIKGLPEVEPAPTPIENIPPSKEMVA